MASSDKSMNSGNTFTPRVSPGPVVAGVVAGFAVAALVAFAMWPQPGDGATADMGAGGPGGGFTFGPSPIEVAAAIETVAAEPVQMLGSVRPRREALVASEVEGVVEAVLVEEGDEVARGQLLARLRTTTRELDLAAARANQREAEARLIRFEGELERVGDLRERGAISVREFELAIADRDAQAQAVSRFVAEAARLDETIARARIVAPFAGEVAAVHVEVGEWAGRGGDVITLMDFSQVEVTIGVPERYVSQAREALRQRVELQVEFDAFPEVFLGRIKALVPQAIPQARSFPLIVVIDNPDGRIRGGMLARLLAQVGSPVPTVLVPKDALVLRSGRIFVYRVSADQSTVEELEVTIGVGFGAWQAVDGAVAAGDLVVTRGNEMLQTGFPVEITGEAEIEPPQVAAPGNTTVAGEETGR